LGSLGMAQRSSAILRSGREEAWWPLFDETQRYPDEHALFPELMAELDAIKARSVVGIDGLVFRRDHAHRRQPVPLPWITPRGDLDYFRGVVKEIIRAAGLRDELSFTSFRHGGFTEGADADMTDAELRARWPTPLRAPTAHIRQADAQTAHLSCSEKTRGEKKGRGLGRGLVKGTRDWLKATLSAPC
jgi:hypothetical protein